jgi:hypothetical protein
MGFGKFAKAFRMGAFKIVAIPICQVVGGDTDHGRLPWLVSSPATDNFKCTLENCHRFLL